MMNLFSRLPAVTCPSAAARLSAMWDATRYIDDNVISSLPYDIFDGLAITRMSV